jgi:hypothetical protein
MKNIFYLSALLMLLVTACKKDNTDTTSSQKNIPGVYKITGLQVKAGSEPKVDVFNQLTTCQQNDTWGFQSDGTFLFGGAATSDCQDGDFSGTWSLNGNTFTVATQQNTTSYGFEHFDGHALTLSTAGTLNSEPATYYITFTKQ